MLCTRVEQNSVVLVGHEPVLGELIGRLLGGGATVDLSKGAVAVLEMDPTEERGLLLGLVPPQAVQKP